MTATWRLECPTHGLRATVTKTPVLGVYRCGDCDESLIHIEATESKPRPRVRANVSEEDWEW